MDSKLRPLLDYRRRHPVACALALAAGGMLLNAAPLRLFFQVDFLFGSVATLLICRLHGAWPAFLAGLLVSLPTCWLWGHPYAVAIFALEGLAVGWLHRTRRQTLLVSDAVYWVFAGMPLVLIFYRGAMSMPWEASVLVMLKQGWNGISNALLANVLFLLAIRVGRLEARRPPLFDWVFTGASLLVMGPVFVFLVLESRRALKELEDRAAEQISGAMDNASQRASHWYGSRFFALERLSDMSAARLGSAGPPQEECERMLRLMPGFAAVYVADANATAVAFAPRTNSAGRSNIGSNYSHREYYKKLAASREPILSDVVPGSEAVPGPLQTLSVPMAENGRFAGYSCGVLNLAVLRELIAAPRHSQVEITLLDPKGRVLASTLKSRRALSEFSDHAHGSAIQIRTNLYLRAPVEGGPEMMRWARSLYGWRAPLSDRWPMTVVAEAPVGPVQRELHRAYIDNFLVGFGSIGLAGLTAFLLTSALARPIKELAAATSQPASESGEPVRWPVFVTAELAALSENFRGAFQALRNSMEKLRLHSEELSGRNAELSSEIARRKQVEESLRLLISNANEAILLLEADLRIGYANPQMARLLGKSDTELLGQDVHSVAGGERLDEILKALAQPDAEPLRPFDLPLQRPDGSATWVLASITPIRNDAGGLEGFLAMLSDISERKAAEQERARYAETLEQQVIERTVHLQESIRELEAFSYSVSHDLRAPLRAMAGYSDFLMEDYADRLDDAAREYLRNIRNSAIKMDRLINDLLEYSRLSHQPLPPKPIDPKPVVERVLQTLAPEIGNRRAEVLKPASFPAVLANSAALEQVLLNLIGNALKFVPKDRTPRVKIDAAAQDGHAVFSIADNGIGIEPEHRERIFGLFQRLHSADEFEGTGVGLAIVRKALDRMNGRVWVESEPGRGSIFHFELPQA